MLIVLTIRTCLKFDGRVLAQIHTLADYYKNDTFKVLLFSNCDNLELKLPSNVEVITFKMITTRLPEVNYFLLFKLFEFGIISFSKLKKLKPDIIHVHDEFAIPGSLLYKKRKKEKVKLIYDDHELYNLDEKSSFYRKLRRWLEFKMFKSADRIIMANQYRADYAKKKIKYLEKKEITIIDNYQYDFGEEKDLGKINFKFERGIKYIINQGVINEYRGSETLKQVVYNLPKNWRLVLLGNTRENYEEFIGGLVKNKESVVYGGRLPQEDVALFWEQVQAAVIFYQTDRINERFCAPNRLFQAANLGLPLIVNQNPVLADFVKMNRCGIVLTDNIIEQQDLISGFFKNYIQIEENAAKMKNKYSYDEVGKRLIGLYQQILENKKKDN
ncbi:MAG TPA: glycosyltransferase [Bacteroidales bacterium]